MNKIIKTDKDSETKPEQFQEIQFLEKGAYGEVHKVIHKTTRRVFAIKKISKYAIIQKNMLNQIYNQLKIMYSMNHPNILKLNDHFQTQTHLCLVMQYIQKGSLLKLLRERKHFDQYTTEKFLKQVISAVDYLHRKSPPIIHRDIKPQNILVDNKNNLKLADFGWSNFSDILRITYCGTESYLAPQMIQKTGHDEKLDYWCLGVLTYQLLCGISPFDSNISDDQERRKKLHDNILKLNYRFPKSMSQIARSFIKGLLQIDPKKRMNIEEMRKHEFLQQKKIIKPIAVVPIKSQNFIGNPEQSSKKSQTDKNVFFTQIKVLAQQNIKLREENKYLNAEVIRYKNEIQQFSKIEKQYNNSKIKFDLYEKRLNDLNNQNKLNQNIIRELKKQIRRLQNEVDFLKDDSSDLNSQITKLSNENTILKQQKEHLTNQIFEKKDNENEKINIKLSQNILNDEDFKFQISNSIKSLKLLFKLNQQKANEILQRQSREALLIKQRDQFKQQLQLIKKQGVDSNIEQQYYIKLNAQMMQHNFELEKILHDKNSL